MASMSRLAGASMRRLATRLGAVVLAASFAVPTLAADQMFVSNFVFGELWRVDVATGTPTLITSGLSLPEDGACAADGSLYFAQPLSNEINRWSQAGALIQNIIPAAGTIFCPEGPSFDAAGNMYTNTRDCGGFTDGAWMLPLGDPTQPLNPIVPPFTTFGEGSDIVVAGPRAGALLLVARGETKVVISDPPGAPVVDYITSATFPADSRLFGVIADGCGDVYVSYSPAIGVSGIAGVQKFDAAGNLLSEIFAILGELGFLDLDSDGNLYVADQGIGRIWRIPAGGGAATPLVDIPGAVGVAICRDRRVPICATAIACDPGGPYLAECTAASGATLVPIAGTVTGGGGPVTQGWTTTCPGGTFDDPASLAPILSVPGVACDLTCEVTITATDGINSASCTAPVRIVDTSAPTFTDPVAPFDVSIWPPNHGYVVYAAADLVGATDACGGVAIRVTGCRSSQPEEVHQGSAPNGGNGDGHFYEDCVVAEDGTQFAVRAERLGACGADSIRTYEVGVTATDDCGNATASLGYVRVEHDRSEHQDVRRGRKLGPNDPPPFPYVHPTAYGDGCD